MGTQGSGREAHTRGTRGAGIYLIAAAWVGISDFGTMSERNRAAIAGLVDQSAIVAPLVDLEIREPTVSEGVRRPFDEAAGRRFVADSRRRLGETSPRVLEAYLSRPDAWRSELTPILESHDVPAEFLYLALIESGMDPAAVSPAEAVGLWQFREDTAREYGLIVRDDLDERTDGRRATSAAGRYLRDLYDQFGSWELAAAAYNAGPGRVRRALERSGAASYWELIEAGHLPSETRAYVPKLVAVVQLAAERAEPPTDLRLSRDGDRPVPHIASRSTAVTGD